MSESYSKRRERDDLRCAGQPRNRRRQWRAVCCAGGSGQGAAGGRRRHCDELQRAISGRSTTERPRPQQSCRGPTATDRQHGPARRDRGDRQPAVATQRSRRAEACRHGGNCKLQAAGCVLHARNEFPAAGLGFQPHPCRPASTRPMPGSRVRPAAELSKGLAGLILLDFPSDVF